MEGAQKYKLLENHQKNILWQNCCAINSIAKLKFCSLLLVYVMHACCDINLQFS